MSSSAEEERDADAALRSRQFAVGASVFRCLESGSIAGLEPLFDERIELSFPFAVGTMPKLVSGRGAAIRLLGAIPKIYEHIKFSIEAKFSASEGSRIVLICSSKGVTRIGENYENDYIIILDFADDRITRWTEYYNPSKLPLSILESV